MRGNEQRRNDDCGEDPLVGEQGEDDDSAERDSGGDGGGQVPARARRRRGTRTRVGRSHGQTSSSSASLCFRISSMCSTVLCVISSSCFSARCASSLPTSPSFSSLSIASLACRRMLR